MDVTTPRTVGNSALSVTPFGFGGGTIGAPQVTNEASFAAVAAAWDTGVRLFDTAPWYGLGRSERRLGLALAARDERATYRVNTKVGKSLVPEHVRDETKKTFCPGGGVRTPRDAISGFRVAFEYTYERILQQHQDSLQRLGLAAVDSLTIHDIDYGYHTSEQIEHHLTELSPAAGGGARALEELRAAGTIQAIGCGCNLESRNADSWLDSLHEDLCERIADLVDLDFFVVAGAYTLLETRALRRIMTLCAERDIGVIAATPYAGGWLANPDQAAQYMYGSADPDIRERSLRMQTICERHGIPLAAAALQFPLAHPCVAAVIPGAKTAEEVRQSHTNLHTDIPPAVWESFKADGLLDPLAPTPA